MNENPPSQNRSAPQTRPTRMRPQARDLFTTFVYVCIALLLVGEVAAMFWLDIFA